MKYKTSPLILILLAAFQTMHTQTNIAEGKPVPASNIINASYALDANTTTYATAPVSSGVKSFVIDLQAIYNINNLYMYFTTNYAKRYCVSGSANNSSFYNISTSNGTPNVSFACPISSNVKGVRYLKVELNIDAQDYLVEMRGLTVFGSLSPIAFDYDNAGNRTSRKVIDLNITGTTTAAVQNLKTETADSSANLSDSEAQKKKPEIYLEELAKQQVAIFPNPTSGKLKIEISNFDSNNDVNISLFDLNGKLVESISKQSVSEINLSNSPNGIYIMRVSIGSEKSEWKIIKQ